ncbi:E3 SUMO-protein ligase KIAA1586-like [Watersipora subatra]|uniref:E3 SUMO-protein ligase KIAA1586-like n=1 Tax=Watersipora subatra TaxID=2589382 RepID=UPI00355C6AA9
MKRHGPIDNFFKESTYNAAVESLTSDESDSVVTTSVVSNIPHVDVSNMNDEAEKSAESNLSEAIVIDGEEQNDVISSISNVDGCLWCQKAPIPMMNHTKGMNPSAEWMEIKVGFEPLDSGAANFKQQCTTKLSMLRGKIAKHLFSEAHKSSEAVFKAKKSNSITQQMLANKSAKHQTSTKKVIHVAYNIAKMNRPYSDLSDHIICYQQNGINMSGILVSDKSCASMISSISSDMRGVLVGHIIQNQSKISVMIDESSTVSNEEGLVIHLRACVDDISTTLFLDLVHLKTADAKSIVDCLIQTLSNHGFDHSYLKRHLICFASDGASVMTGPTSGVGRLLLDRFPDIILWHCSNQKLELAVGDAIEEVGGGISSFKIFVTSLHSLYSQSPKMQEEVKHLVAHFKSHPNDTKFQGFVATLTSQNFVINLGIMLDALEEVSRLSLLLQNRDVSLVTANSLIDQTIKAMRGYIDVPVSSRKGEKAANSQKHSDEYFELLSQVSLLDPCLWPANYEEVPRFGEVSIESLCDRFRVDVDVKEQIINGFRLYKAMGGKTSNTSLKNLQNMVKCIPVSTAECERGFSLMNTIITSKKNRLNIKQVSGLMVVNIVGPPIHLFNPTEKLAEKRSPCSQ